MMEFDVEGLCIAGFDVKSPDRLNSCNGHRYRQVLHPRRLDAFGGRAGRGDGRVGHFEKPGFAARRRDR